VLERRDQAEVVEGLRPQLDGESANVVERLDDLLANGGEGLCALLVALRLLDRLQAEQHRVSFLPGLVVQLPCESAALELLRLDDPAECVAGDAGGEVDRRRRARSERLGQAQVGIGEAWSALCLVVATITPIGRPAAISGT
jgi:hypothetical protein